MTIIKLGKIKINYSFIIVFLINLLTNNFLEFISLIGAFLIHELGHFIVIKILKGKIYKFDISALGGVISTNLSNNILVLFGRHLIKSNMLSITL